MAALLPLGPAWAAPPTAPNAAPADDGRPIVIGRAYDLPAKILGDTRRINIYLPDHFGEAGLTFPVIFLLDGGEKEDFLHIAGLAQITAAYGAGRELIVVGIEGRDRRHDLTAPSDQPADRTLLPTAGGADAYRRFLTEELKPWAVARFPVARIALMGESLAGLFTAETLLKAPASFDDYIVVSPSLWWNGGALARAAAGDLARGGFAHRRAWIAFDDPAPPPEAAAKERAQQQALADAFARATPPDTGLEGDAAGRGARRDLPPGRAGGVSRSLRGVGRVGGAVGEGYPRTPRRAAMRPLRHGASKSAAEGLPRFAGEEK